MGRNWDRRNKKCIANIVGNGLRMGRGFADLEQEFYGVIIDNIGVGKNVGAGMGANMGLGMGAKGPVIIQGAGSHFDRSTNVDNRGGLIQRSAIGGSEERLRICPYCGKELNFPKTSRFCPYCREQIME